MRVLSWLLVPLAAAGVWYSALLGGLLAVGILDSFCPPDEMVSGFCTAPWHAPAVDALAVALAASAAFFIVVTCGRVAPSRKFQTALVVFVCGAIFASYAASDGRLWTPFIAAAAGGMAGLAIASSRWRVPLKRS